MNLGVWQEDARAELWDDTPPDQPMRMWDGRKLNPYWCFIKGAMRYNAEVQFAPPAQEAVK